MRPMEVRLHLVSTSNVLVCNIVLAEPQKYERCIVDPGESLVVSV